MTRGLVTVFVACIACGGGGNGAAAPNMGQAAPCATHGASYASLSTVMSCSGACANVPDSSQNVVVIGNDGTIAPPTGYSCKTGPGALVSGCTSYLDESCTFQNGQCNELLQGKVIWASDGSSGVGDATETIVCGASTATVAVNLTYSIQ